ncbi:MAG TPA: NADH-quinone oxidoreductase subunit N [Chitinophagaceae bacterium]|jgi:NADH-quinone oxidoreductase subunit N|nr:NADH-quinone oxidoreductase subunit N [Chitinophagaceae bacterium]
MVQQFFLLARQELAITLVIFILLFIKVGAAEWSNKSIFNLVNILLLVNFLSGFFFVQDGVLFNEMFHTNNLVVTEKNILNFGTLIISLQSYDWIQQHKHVVEFYVLLLSTLLGMFFMISAGNILMFYLGLELASIPLAAIANFDLEKRQSSEGAMKFIISSAFSSGLLLFGISMLYGTTGTLIFSELPQYLTGTPLQLFALVLLIAGFAFKISVVPFHLWTADVYEGSPVAVTAYLSVISKGAAVFVFVQVLYTVFKPLAEQWYTIVFLLSVLTMLVGNLFALRQTNIKRLLAFSSIAQAGFILVGISGSSQAGMASVVYFILVYIFSNLGAFGVVSIVSALTGKENTEDYKGFYKTNPFLAWVMAISLFSLAGVPPAAGFFGKFFLLIAGAGKANYVLIVIAALNMIISLYYYLMLVRIMFIDRNEQAPIEKLPVHIYPKLALLVCMAGIMLVGLISGVYEYIYSLSAY